MVVVFQICVNYFSSSLLNRMLEKLRIVFWVILCLFKHNRYADDTRATVTCTSPASAICTLNVELQIKMEWFKCYHLILNAFHQCVCQPVSDRNFIATKCKATFLGVLPDECLKFQDHVLLFVTNLFKYYPPNYELNYYLSKKKTTKIL